MVYTNFKAGYEIERVEYQYYINSLIRLTVDNKWNYILDVLFGESRYLSFTLGELNLRCFDR